jgi:diadenylate cyclase
MIVEITRNPLFQIFIRKHVKYQNIDDILDAVVIMSKTFVGALIVFPQTQAVSMSSIDAGVPINANASKELLLSIFNTKSPLHDGAVIVNNKLQITEARCILPLSPIRQVGSRLLGTRHRAALGLTEKIDAVVLVVSEETGTISIAQGGVLEIGIPHEKLKEKLNEKFSKQRAQPQAVF